MTEVAAAILREKATTKERFSKVKILDQVNERMPPSKANPLGGPSVAERIKRASNTNLSQTPIKKEMPSAAFKGVTTQGMVKMRRESYTTTPGSDSTKAANGKVNTSTKK